MNDRLVDYGMAQRRLEHSKKHLRKIFGDMFDEYHSTLAYLKLQNAPDECREDLIDYIYELTEEFGLIDLLTSD